MKKMIISLLIITSVFTILSGCGISRLISCKSKPKLNVYNWGEYIEQEVISDFEKKHNICVVYDTFLDNETAITKMQTQKYDVVFPSEYAIEQLKEQDLIEKINWSKLSVNKEEVFADELMNLINYTKENFEYDFLEYGIPYFWGSVGIIYNPEKVALSELQRLNWDILKEKKYDQVFYDSSKDAYMIALKQLGKSMNTSNMEDINLATTWLKDTTKDRNDNLTFLTDEILESMPNEEYDMAVCYSGDANYIMDKNNKMKFFKPNGTNVWIDGMVIPKNAENKDLGYQFIDFLLTHDIALRNTIDAGFTTPIKTVYEVVTSEGGAYSHLTDSYKIEVTKNDEMYQYLGLNIKAHIENEWLKIRSSK